MEGPSRSSCNQSKSTRTLDRKIPGFLFYSTKEMMKEIECEFGCECDVPAQPFGTVLEQIDLDRLIREKIDRARRYIELRNDISDAD